MTLADLIRFSDFGPAEVLAEEYKRLIAKSRELRARIGEPPGRSAFRADEWQARRAEREARRLLAAQRLSELDERLEVFSLRDDADNRERRVLFVVELMTGNVFERGRTGRALAKHWGVSLDRVRGICSDAFRLLRALSSLDDAELSVWRRHAVEWFGKQEGAHVDDDRS